MTRLRVAVFGAGNWGKNHVRSLATLSDVELTAICDLDATVRDVIGRRYPGVLLTDSADEAFDTADAAVIATPAASHPETEAQPLRRGVERPHRRWKARSRLPVPSVPATSSSPARRAPGEAWSPAPAWSPVPASLPTRAEP